MNADTPGREELLALAQAVENVKLNWMFVTAEQKQIIAHALRLAAKPAEPQPATDGVREALDGFVGIKKHTWDDLYGCLSPNSGFGRKWIERFDALRAALSASVPSPDGAGEDDKAADGNTYRYHATDLPAGGDAISSTQHSSGGQR